jgi:hypothetical protein
VLLNFFNLKKEKVMPKYLTPHLKAIYDKVIQIQKENPTLSMKEIVKKAGTNYDSYWRAKRLVLAGVPLSTTSRSVPVRKQEVSSEPTNKLPKMTTIPIETTSTKTPLILVLGAQEDIAKLLNSFFN